MEVVTEVNSRTETRRRLASLSVRNSISRTMNGPSTTTTTSTSGVVSTPKNAVNYNGFYKASVDFDLGEYLNAPFVPYIPSSIHPNQITALNHLCHWFLFGTAMITPFLSDSNQPLGFIACAILNYLTMTLDCLDGMHARYSKQCSRLGEFLDHWCDSLHVPLLSSGIVVALGFTPLQIIIATICNASVYASQLIVYHYQNVFYPTGGVEGQVGTSILYLIAAYLSYANLSIQTLTIIRTVLFVVGVIVTLKFLTDFLRKFNHLQSFKMFLFILTEIIPAIFYYFNMYSTFVYLLISSLISFRIVGSYVLFTILHWPYKGYHRSIFIWFIILFWTQYVMQPITLSVFTSKIINIQYLHSLTIQDILPYVFIGFLANWNLKDFREHYYLLKKLK